MAQFDEQIKQLKRKIADPRTREIDKASALHNLETLIEALEDAVHSLVERVSILERPGKGPLGFGKSE